MFNLDRNIRYYVYTGTVNMNMGINGLFRVVRAAMHRNPLSGDAYIFFSKNRQMVKILRWDGDGFILYSKRLERGTFEFPDRPSSGEVTSLSWETFCHIMEGISLRSVRYRNRYRVCYEKVKRWV